jgi:hypothetical protein
MAAIELLGPKSAPISALVYFTQPGVAVETPPGDAPPLHFPAAALLGGHLPAPEPSVCRNCGYHVRRICDADRAQIG